MAECHQNHAIEESASTPFALAKYFDSKNTNHPSQLPFTINLSFEYFSSDWDLEKMREECCLRKVPLKPQYISSCTSHESINSFATPAAYPRDKETDLRVLRASISDGWRLSLRYFWQSTQVRKT